MFKNTPFDMSGQTAMITGASGGLGGRFAQVLANANANLVLAARNADNPRLLDLEQSIGNGVEVHRVSLDVSSPDSVSEAVTSADKLIDGGISILINNAGIAEPATAKDTDAEKWNRIIGTNLSGCLLYTSPSPRD